MDRSGSYWQVGSGQGGAQAMSALIPKADITQYEGDVRFVPKAEISKTLEQVINWMAERPHCTGHWDGTTNIQIPAATKPIPAMRAIQRPTGVTFSTSTRTERSAIQRTFI